MVKKIGLVLLIFVFWVFEMHSQQGYFQLRGRIYSKTKKTLSNVRIKVYEGNVVHDSAKTSQQGVFSLRFKLNSNFIIEIAKAQYATKRIIVNTEVPKGKGSDFFDLFNFIFLDDVNKADIRSKNGLPVAKYYYKGSINDFTGEKISSKEIFNSDNTKQNKIKSLQAELNIYKQLVEEQKRELEENKNQGTNAKQIKLQARLYADSIVRAANRKAQELIKIVKKDSSVFADVVEKNTKEITKEEFKKLAVSKKEFESKKNIQELKSKITTLKSQQNKTTKDSLDLKKNRLTLRKELFKLAQYQFEIDRLSARTQEDSTRIKERETQLFEMEQSLLIADREIENANNKIVLKNLEIKNKNITIISFLIGSFLLLILLAIIYYNYRDKKKINKILEYQNQELEKLSIVASETSNAIIITDETGNFVWINHGYTRLFGYKIEEVTGKNQKSIINKHNAPEINEQIEKTLKTGESVNYEFESLSKAGKKIWVQTTLTPILDKENNISKLIAIDSDISKIKEAELEILTQSRLLSKQNKQIMDSINYGKRIQDAILPSEELIRSYFPQSFIYFKPRDIVSGDFYWFSVQDNRLFVAAVDCTGHGVPGAFMSMIGNSLLNHIVNERKIHIPSEILKELNIGVNRALSQSQQDNHDREDGMDLTICRFDKKKKEIQFSCANHTLLVLSNGGIEEIEGDEISIGESYSKVENLEFTNHILPFKKNSTIYLFSDGYPDQIGGPKNKRFLAGKFKKFLQENQNEDMELQFHKLNEAFDDWKGDNKQTDDVLVMGIKLS